MATVAKKVNLFNVINRAELSERIPRVPGAFHFALPFLGDAAVTWADILVDEIWPRATLVSRYPELQADGVTPEPKAGQIYPTPVAQIVAGLADGALQGAIDAKDWQVANFLGVLIDGFDYTKDLNITVTLAGGIPLIYLQGDPTAPALTVDPNIETVADALGLKIFNDQVFWNKVQ